MMALRFRTRLMLSMTLVVGSVTGATILLVQQRVAGVYQRLFEGQFKIQAASFLERQRIQTTATAIQIGKITRSPRIISALGEGDPKLIYDNIFTESRSLIETSSESGLNVPLIRFLDAEGHLIPTADPRFGISGKDPQTQLRPQGLQALLAKKGEEKRGRSESGYLADSSDGSNILRKYNITPVVNDPNEAAVGALIVGLPSGGAVSEGAIDSNGVLSGIWLDKNFYSEVIPKSALEAVAQKVTYELSSKAEESYYRTVDINGVPHRLFYTAIPAGNSFPLAYQVCLFSMQGLLVEQKDLRMKIGCLGLIAMAGALVPIWLLSHGLTVPLQQIVLGTNEIRRGNFHYKVPIRSMDEVGELAASFNEMADGLALSKRYQSVLSQVADREVAEALMKGEVVLGGELREVSVLFCDIRGFTALTQGMPPVEVIALLNEHMSALTAVVYECNGVVDKFVGDLIMAIFGAPKSYGNDASNAARCALRMVEERRQLNLTSVHPIDVGIGVATGTVVVGCMGSNDRLNYTVLGERVNLASRLCGAARPMECVIDEITRERLGEMSECTPLLPLRLKGFSEIIQAYCLAGKRSEVSTL